MYGRAEGIADHYWPWAIFSASSQLVLGSQNEYGRAEGIADHYWPWAVFLKPPSLVTVVVDDLRHH